METLVVILIFCCIAAIATKVSNSNRDKELYYLKNLKFLEENSQAVISDINNFGDYYVSYEKDGKNHYHFFDSRKKRNLQCPIIAKKYGVDDIVIGQRPSYLPEHNKW
ncbi:hypothetical protein [Pseudoalteromonas luteoviolacea]|uniref:Uncharacterized protein n=1 Tax=Pseudoalteromonas luteoviolacea DSM 6061 TaxID=1365250 RepID=A0A167D9X5_9GAMM|nr:hypothetical protein [Pseudoalteromonas luteoviolacea]KZN48591.1 hypothetical protein N475_06065 [Pseudoalteromonas luteoviolacea DSM 6061]KZN49247.1 hypothetical protein N474_24795 [Pseudoalteromonas luteoviolacea CPMOR-2]MBE0388706.1 hypothetical protein [Pseudoalteromonas luteoviolacea DSM 6061]TQF70150.1 hypothetical protein FLM44_03390 [Pseudoalteromonas luteoviolacea]